LGRMQVTGLTLSVLLLGCLGTMLILALIALGAFLLFRKSR